MRDSFLLSGTSTVWQNLRPCLAARKELELKALSRIPLSPPSRNVTLSSIPISRVRKRFHSLLVAVCTFPYQTGQQSRAALRFLCPTHPPSRSALSSQLWDAVWRCVLSLLPKEASIPPPQRCQLISRCTAKGILQPKHCCCVLNSAFRSSLHIRICLFSLYNIQSCTL